MSREHKDYRNNIELINAHFADKEVLSLSDVMQVTGYKSASSIRRHFPMNRGKIAKATLARRMCELWG